jgi:hypothetical protein
MRKGIKRGLASEWNAPGKIRARPADHLPQLCELPFRMGEGPASPGGTASGDAILHGLRACGCPVLAEAVEELPRVRIFETMI